VKTLPLSEVKAKLSQLVDEVESLDERVVITRKGRPAAVPISQDDLEIWQETLEITADRALMTERRQPRWLTARPAASLKTPRAAKHLHT
jgi:antitoxin YefM